MMAPGTNSSEKDVTKFCRCCCCKRVITGVAVMTASLLVISAVVHLMSVSEAYDDVMWPRVTNQERLAGHRKLLTNFSDKVIKDQSNGHNQTLSQGSSASVMTQVPNNRSSSLDLAAVEALPKPAPQTSAEASNYVAYIPIPMEEGDDDYVDDEAEADFRSDFGSEGRHSKTPFLVPLVVVPKDEPRRHTSSQRRFDPADHDYFYYGDEGDGDSDIGGDDDYFDVEFFYSDHTFEEDLEEEPPQPPPQRRHRDYQRPPNRRRYPETRIDYRRPPPRRRFHRPRYIPPPPFPFLHRVPGPPYPGPPPRAPNKPMDQTKIHPSNYAEVYEAPPGKQMAGKSSIQVIIQTNPDEEEDKEEEKKEEGEDQSPTIIVVQQPLQLPYKPLNLLGVSHQSVAQPYANIYQISNSSIVQNATLTEGDLDLDNSLLEEGDKEEEEDGTLEDLTSTNVISRVPAPSHFGNRRFGPPSGGPRFHPPPRHSRRPPQGVNRRGPDQFMYKRRMDLERPPRPPYHDRRRQYHYMSRRLDEEADDDFREKRKRQMKDFSQEKSDHSYKDVQGIIDQEFRSKFKGFPRRVSHDPPNFPPNIFKDRVPPLGNDRENVQSKPRSPIRRPPPKHKGVNIPGVTHPPDSGSIQDIISHIDQRKPKLGSRRSDSYDHGFVEGSLIRDDGSYDPSFMDDDRGLGRGFGESYDSDFVDDRPGRGEGGSYDPGFVDGIAVFIENEFPREESYNPHIEFEVNYNSDPDIFAERPQPPPRPRRRPPPRPLKRPHLRSHPGRVPEKFGSIPRSRPRPPVYKPKKTFYSDDLSDNVDEHIGQIPAEFDDRPYRAKNNFYSHDLSDDVNEHFGPIPPPLPPPGDRRPVKKRPKFEEFSFFPSVYFDPQDSTGFKDHPQFPKGPTYDDDHVIPPVVESKFKDAKFQELAPGPEIFDGKTSLYSPFGPGTSYKRFPPSPYEKEDVVHNPGVVKTIDQLSQSIPSGPPGYQYKEPNFRRPIGGGPVDKNDHPPVIPRPVEKNRPSVINPSDYSFFAQPPHLLSDTYRDKNPVFKAKSPILDYNLTPDDFEEASVPNDIYEGVMTFSSFEEAKAHGYDFESGVYQDPNELIEEEFADKPLPKEGRQKPVNIGLDVYPMGGNSNKDHEKQKVLVHLNLFSKKQQREKQSPYSYVLNRKDGSEVVDSDDVIYPASVEDTVEVEEVEDDQSVDPIKLFNTLMGNSQEKSPLIGSDRRALPSNVNEKSVLRVPNLQTEDTMKKMINGKPWYGQKLMSQAESQGSYSRTLKSRDKVELHPKLDGDKRKEAKKTNITDDDQEYEYYYYYYYDYIYPDELGNGTSEVVKPETLPKPMPISSDDDDKSVSKKLKKVKKRKRKTDAIAEESEREE